MNELQGADPRVLQECLRVLEGLVRQQQQQGVPDMVQQQPTYAAQAAATHYARPMEAWRGVHHMSQPMQASLPVYQGRGLRMPQVIRPVPSQAAAVPQRLHMLVERVMSDRRHLMTNVLPRKEAGNGIDMLVSSAQLLNSSEAIMGQGAGPAGMQPMLGKASQAQYSHMPRMRESNSYKDLNSDEDEMHYDDDLDKEAARLEHSRRKNREAQQRFRDKRKQMLIDMEKNYDEICIQCDDMEIANDKLRDRCHFLSRDLVVRELMLMTLEHKPPAKDSLLAQVLSEKELKEIEKNSMRIVKHTNTSLGEPVSGSNKSSEQAEEVAPEKVAEEVQEMRNIAKSLDTPDTFQLYWREWQVELKHLLHVYLEDRDESSLQDIRVKFDKMVKVWTYNTRFHPNVFKIVTSKMTLKDDIRTELWQELAVEIMKTTPEANVNELYKFWRKYLSKMDILKGYREKAESALRQLENSYSRLSPENYSLYNFGRCQIETAALAYELHQIAEKIWRYSLRLCTAWALAIGEVNIALCHAKTEPNMPNWILITKNMIDIAGKNGIILVDDDNEEFSGTKSMEDLFS